MIRVLCFTFLFVTVVVFGDTNVTIEQYPYHVSIQNCGRHICSGALIHESWIVTAASCLSGIEYSTVSVRVRTAVLSTGGSQLEISTTITHPNFDKYTYQNNIALLKLKVPVEYGPKLQPITLPANKDYQPTDGSMSFVTGWWHNFEPTKSILTVIPVPIVNQRICKSVMPSYAPLSNGMICAGYMMNEVDTCQGDVGAPLMEGQTLIGVLSYGLGCKTMIHPGIYTRISTYLPWISASSGVSYM